MQKQRVRCPQFPKVLRSLQTKEEKQMLAELISLMLSLIISHHQPDLNEKFIDTVHKYSVSYPSDWTLSKGKESISLSAPIDQTSDDLFQEVLSIHVQKEQTDVNTMEQYQQRSINDIRSVMGDRASITVQEAQIHGKSAKLLIYEMQYKGSIIKIKKHFLKHSNHFYVFTFTSIPSEFEQSASVADEMVKSFVFID